jgi:hypothetical protein
MQEASIIWDVLVTNFLCLFMVKKELHSDSLCVTGPARCGPTIGWHDGITYGGCGREPGEGHFEARERPGKRLHLIMLPYKASTQETTSMTIASVVTGESYIWLLGLFQQGASQNNHQHTPVIYS